MLDYQRLTVLPDATSVTSSCGVTASLQVLADQLTVPEAHGEVPSELSLGVPAVNTWEPKQLWGPDVTVPVSAGPDAPTLEAALQDVSCPASIMEI